VAAGAWRADTLRVGEPNRAFELHDSDVTAVSWVGSELHLEMEAYVHASNGVPGVDGGSGWIWLNRAELPSRADGAAVQRRGS
jgi:hypothetical protein